MSGDGDFEKMVKDLQSKIEQDEEKDYSKTVINEYRNPNNFGDIEEPDAFGEIKGPCGDTMKISLMIEDEKIINACFWTDGCGASIACGSMLTKMITGKTVETALDITSEQLTDTLGGLPKEHLHCTVLTVNTLQEAIKNYHKVE
ncbi:MAG: iron-sulfur cluster assembly scaffold protein [Candidatus Thermoplasmatota archaeon]